jgi:hypothetical protein
MSPLPALPFGEDVARFNGQNVLHHSRFPAFQGPDATVALWVRWIQQPIDFNSSERPPQQFHTAAPPRLAPLILAGMM